MPHELWGIFQSSWWEQELFSGSGWSLGIVPSNLFGWLLTHTHWNRSGPFADLGSFLCKALYSPILCPVNSSSLPLDSQLHLLNSWKARGNFWILFSCAMLETPSSQWARAIVGLTSLVSHPSEITVLCCLISTVLKTIASDSYLYLYLKSPIF